VYFFFGVCGTQLVEALRYKAVGRGFDLRWDFYGLHPFCLTLAPGVDSTSNRN